MKYLTILAAVAAISGASAASALTLDLDFQGTYALEENIAVGTPNYSGAAGGLKMAIKTGPEAGFQFAAWCLDIGTYIKDSLYDVWTKADPVFGNGGSAVSLSNQKKEDIQSLYDIAYSDVSSNLDKKKYSGGFQLALWEIIYESGSSYGLGDGTFQDAATGSQSGRTSAFNYANTILGNLGTDTATDDYSLFFLEAEENNSGGHKSQNLVTGFATNTPPFSPPPVPIPATGLLLIGALGGLGVIRRRRRPA